VLPPIPVVPPPPVTVPLPITPAGVVPEPVTVNFADLAIASIREGTRALVDGQPVTAITIAAAPPPATFTVDTTGIGPTVVDPDRDTASATTPSFTLFAVVAPGGRIVGGPYDFKPDGARFDPPILLTLRYDSALIPAGVREEELRVVRLVPPVPPPPVPVWVWVVVAVVAVVAAVVAFLLRRRRRG
jgi:hypothetical protein